MPGLLPHRFLFRFAIPIRADESLPKRKTRLTGLSEDFQLPDLGRLDAVKPFATVRMAWNDRGLGVTVHVQGKRQPVTVNRLAMDASDGVTLWIDTRPSQNVHRATRYCHQFLLLPRGGGPQEDQPLALPVPIARAREMQPPCPGTVLIAADVTKDGYWLDGWIPADAMHGFDPEANPKLGFSYLVRDSELGEQPLTVGSEFPISYDPSLWSTLELKR